MENIVLKRGRKGFPLTEEQKRELLEILNKERFSLPEMAKKIGISKKQLRKPLRDGGNCSRESLLIVEKFLARQKRKSEKDNGNNQ